MTLIYSLYLGIGDNINGNIIEAYGYKGLYLVAMIVASMGFVLGIIRYLYNRKEVKSE